MKVEMNEAPALTPKAAGTAADPVFVTDSLGRKLQIRKLRASERFKLSRNIGPVSSSNNSCMIQALTAASVIGIDDEGQPFPRDEDHLYKRLDELGDEGLAAATPAVLELYGLILRDEDIDALKN